jgi:hypothetical protein
MGSDGIITSHYVLSQLGDEKKTGAESENVDQGRWQPDFILLWS